MAPPHHLTPAKQHQDGPTDTAAIPVRQTAPAHPRTTATARRLATP
ncbi:hypothetical protein OG453_43865 [Streptomyces sp. NBC_01381]|nr:hypothetical protein [Streptomyces sp. NBC_01381]MCX4673500.1 hypothetical protein [Streptomyces sp. NBC_01381]